MPFYRRLPAKLGSLRNQRALLREIRLCNRKRQARVVRRGRDREQRDDADLQCQRCRLEPILHIATARSSEDCRFGMPRNIPVVLKFAPSVFTGTIRKVENRDQAGAGREIEVRCRRRRTGRGALSAQMTLHYSKIKIDLKTERVDVRRIRAVAVLP